ncbi:heterokaryon incompatibility protein-domain-containing protein [Microdochium bolleyi]|uniref:Heterokaryon incompatibility protein-domain-containing protein n=1 Tax=Microdochium bolleyi TaxID=196109 RepID=A0A136INK2_9PEZI|nr:heterokaryon incompatibility protein-domain-containing protein [Microdochium bolleyi]
MFLINTTTLRLEYFIGEHIPPYSILSHRWEDEEVDHQTFKSAHRGANLKGYDKIAAACAQSLRQGIDYTWVDTCCIDKTSSAELTESINSMFAWYEKAVVCFAFLCDVNPNAQNPSDTTIESSEWLKRGWTLQELLAPRKVEFYASDWTYIATRHELAVKLSLATGIADCYLLDRPAGESRRRRVLKASMGERMSWAARRRTTRKEDESYCLLGLFGVNMPLIYGEGGDAFIRLQEEILRHSFDPTLLAWGTLGDGDLPLMPVEKPDPPKVVSVLKHMCGMFQPWSRSWQNKDDAVEARRGFLAPDARHFLCCDKLVASSGSELGWDLTPGGLQINLPVSRWMVSKRHPYLVLPCFSRSNPGLLLAIPIVAMGDANFCRGTVGAILVSAHKWYQWPRADVILLTRSSSSDYDGLSTSSVVGCDVWIRSIPVDFSLADLPDVSYDFNPDRLLRADEAWIVSGEVDLEANLEFSIESQDEARLSIHVRRGPYTARPLPSYLPNFVRYFLATSERYYSAVSIKTSTGQSLMGTTEERGTVLRPGSDIVETVCSGLVSVELTEVDIAGRLLLVIDIRHGPSRLGHLWTTMRYGSLRIPATHRATAATKLLPSAHMLQNAITSIAVSLYDIFQQLAGAGPAIHLIATAVIPEGNRVLSMLMRLVYLSFGLKVMQMYGVRRGSFIGALALYSAACYTLWLLFADESAGAEERGKVAEAGQQGHSPLSWVFVVRDAVLRSGINFVCVSALVYTGLPTASILAPRAAPFLRSHRFMLAATGSGLLLHWAPSGPTVLCMALASLVFMGTSFVGEQTA